MPLKNETIYEPVPVLLFDVTAGDLDYRQGQLWWDATDQTLRLDVGNGAQRVTLQIGQEQHVLVHNKTGVDWPDGIAGYADGAVGYRPTAALSKADNILTANVQGMATQAIAKNTSGFAATFGLVRGLNTNAWTEGDLLYLSETTAGELQNTVPTSGYTIIVGRVLRKHPTDGVIFVNPRPVPAFGDIAGGNYTEFEYDGTMQAVGNATTWRDELGILIGQRLESPGSDIVQNLAEGTLTFKASARYPTDYVSYSLQLNHDWLIGSLAEFHSHWFQTSAANVNWLGEYRWQVNGQAKTTAWTKLALSNQIFTYSAGTLVQINDGVSSITPPVTAGLSDIVQIRLYRDYTNASGEFSGAESSGLNVDALAADMHRRSNKMGSRQEYIK